MMVWGTQSKDKASPVRVEDAFPALGIPPALYAGGDGGSAREGNRQLLTASLEPYASLITAEFREKIGYSATLNFRRLAAADIAARARAYGTLKASGVSEEDAAEVSGLDLYAERENRHIRLFCAPVSFGRERRGNGCTGVLVA